MNQFDLRIKNVLTIKRKCFKFSLVQSNGFIWKPALYLIVQAMKRRMPKEEREFLPVPAKS